MRFVLFQAVDIIKTTNFNSILSDFDKLYSQYWSFLCCYGCHLTSQLVFLKNTHENNEACLKWRIHTTQSLKLTQKANLFRGWVRQTERESSYLVCEQLLICLLHIRIAEIIYAKPVPQNINKSLCSNRVVSTSAIVSINRRVVFKMLLNLLFFRMEKFFFTSKLCITAVNEMIFNICYWLYFTLCWSKSVNFEIFWTEK